MISNQPADFRASVAMFRAPDVQPPVVGLPSSIASVPGWLVQVVPGAKKGSATWFGIANTTLVQIRPIWFTGDVYIYILNGVITYKHL